MSVDDKPQIAHQHYETPPEPSIGKYHNQCRYYQHKTHHSRFESGVAGDEPL
jgi:hypothetical protein